MVCVGGLFYGLCGNIWDINVKLFFQRVWYVIRIKCSISSNVCKLCAWSNDDKLIVLYDCVLCDINGVLVIYWFNWICDNPPFVNVFLP